MPVLTGKIALITGGSRGIGAAIAQRLAADGAAVAITYAASPDKASAIVAAIQSAGGKAVAIQADAADPAAVERSVTQTAEQLGGLDILVNSVGALHVAPIDQFPADQFEHVLSVNVRSAFYACRAAAKLLRDAGRIINVGSVNSDSMPFPGGSVYALTKGAIAAFTRGLARDSGPRNITVNNIQPGPVDTDMNPANGPSADFLKSLMAIKRFGHPDEIAALVAFLATPQAAFITGTSIKIDGGFDA